ELQRNFLFLGHRDDVPAVLSCCDVAVLPSRAEGLPNALIEYMAAGLPAVASNVGGSAEIIRDGATGLLVPPQNSQALGEALLRLLRDPDLAHRLARSGQEYVRQNYSFSRMLTETDRLYVELVQRKAARKDVTPWENRWQRLVSMSHEEFAARVR